MDLGDLPEYGETGTDPIYIATSDASTVTDNNNITGQQLSAIADALVPLASLPEMHATHMLSLSVIESTARDMNTHFRNISDVMFDLAAKFSKSTNNAGTQTDPIIDSSLVHPPKAIRSSSFHRSHNFDSLSNGVSSGQITNRPKPYDRNPASQSNRFTISQTKSNPDPVRPLISPSNEAHITTVAPNIHINGVCAYCYSRHNTVTECPIRSISARRNILHARDVCHRCGYLFSLHNRNSCQSSVCQTCKNRGHISDLCHSDSSLTP